LIPPLNWELGSWIAAVIAAPLSVAAIFVAIWAARKANTLQGKMVQIETAREHDRVLSSKSASLSAELFRPGPHSGALRISNSGPATARNVVILFDGQPVSEHPLIHDADDAAEILGPGASVEYGITTFDQMPKLFEVALQWDDDSRENRIWQSHLTLPRF
jgi:hypothetical protein